MDRAIAQHDIDDDPMLQHNRLEIPFSARSKATSKLDMPHPSQARIDRFTSAIDIGVNRAAEIRNIAGLGLGYSVDITAITDDGLTTNLSLQEPVLPRNTTAVLSNTIVGFNV